ncbi:hypothetical protein I215_01948 [Galbibacter marinus]|uniref:Uncharacterized protein n=1 Tax=Galbibacter marinus TaxID=555500 RepID=K2Q626_9FLAO|nr:hypothetical protein [Galbibacter marinus]EKF56246.1 hypothetical protein I215_01948 [Galbibacter marinus]
MNPENKLDHVLKYLYDQYQKENLTHDHCKDICKLAQLNVNQSESYIILSKLQHDGYVDTLSQNKWLFRINYNGILFHRYGGYKQKLKDVKRDRFKKDIYNWMIAIGTSLAGLYALWQFWLEIVKT